MRDALKHDVAQAKRLALELSRLSSHDVVPHYILIQPPRLDRDFQVIRFPILPASHLLLCFLFCLHQHPRVMGPMYCYTWIDYNVMTIINTSDTSRQSFAGFLPFRFLDMDRRACYHHKSKYLEQKIILRSTDMQLGVV